MYYELRERLRQEFSISLIKVWIKWRLYNSALLWSGCVFSPDWTEYVNWTRRFICIYGWTQNSFRRFQGNKLHPRSTYSLDLHLCSRMVGICSADVEMFIIYESFPLHFPLTLTVKCVQRFFNNTPLLHLMLKPNKEVCRVCLKLVYSRWIDCNACRQQSECFLIS